MKRIKKTWLLAAALMALCTVCSPVHAEESADVSPTETVEVPAPVPTETPIETPTETLAETPVEIPVEAPAPAAPIVTENGVPVIPVALTDRLAPETYAELSDPNAKIIVIDISDQYVWAFENGTSALGSPMISGKANTKRETSRGTFAITYKRRGKYLTGYKDDGTIAYQSWVNYWMRFDDNRSIGLHDANWRTDDQYNPETYVTNGSHGCVNLPCAFAPILYDFVEVGTMVVVQD